VPLRRRPEPEASVDTDLEVAAVENAPKPGGKGRPTPKRSESQQRRRTPVVAPTTRREAYRMRRQRIKSERQTTRSALATGDEKHLPARDAGPGRRLARDVVDSRRNLAEMFMPLALVAFIALIAVGSRAPVAAAYVNLALLLLFVAVIVDSIRVGRRARQLVAERHGEAETRGVAMYAAMRASSLRRLRMPPPKVQRGAKV
jgi:hypothetical protein